MRSGLLALLLVVALDACMSDSPRETGQDVNDRVRQWIRGGTKELGRPLDDVVPPHVPGQGFGPESPRKPGSSRRNTP
jgi:hypothetical protein